MEKGSDEIFFLQKTVMELQRTVFELSARVVQVEQELAKTKAQKAAAGRASAQKRWGNGPAKPEVVTALQISTPKKTRPRKEKSDVVVTALLTALPKPKPVSRLYDLVEHWRAEYSRIYNTEAMKPSKKDFGHAKFILEKCGSDWDQAAALVTHFMNRREYRYVTKGHTLQTLVGDIERLWAELSNGKIITQAAAKQAALWEHNIDMATAEESGPNILEIFEQQERKLMENKNGNKALPRASETDVPFALCNGTKNS